jgi:uncharacterized coiled-coil DUF342 family protein
MQLKVTDPVEAEIRSLRRESMKYRHQRNDARAEVAQLRAEVESLRAALNRSITARVVGR